MAKATETADEFSPPHASRKRRVSAENAIPRARHSNRTPWTLPSTPPAPVARPGKGAGLQDSLEAMERALEGDGPGFIACTILWRRLLAFASDREIARHQAALVHRYRRVLARRGYPSILVYSVLERSERHGLHGHILAQAPRIEDHVGILDAVEAGLHHRFGRLPHRTFKRDGRRYKGNPRPLGSIWTAKQARGALRYRLKSLPREAEECGVRRGVGLRPVECIAIKVSRGRSHAG